MHFATQQAWEVNNPFLQSQTMNNGLPSRRFYPMVEMFLMLAVFVVEIETDHPLEGDSVISNLLVSNFRQLLVVLKTTKTDDSSRVRSIHVLRKLEDEDVGSGDPELSVKKVVEIREGVSASGKMGFEFECSDGNLHDGFMSVSTGEVLESVRTLYSLKMLG